MNVRVRGLLIVLGSAAAAAPLYWLLYYVLADGNRTRVPAYPLALPVVGMIYGATELVSGRPFADLARAWDSLPRWVQIPLGLVVGAALVVGIFYGAAFVLTGGKF